MFGIISRRMNYLLIYPNLPLKIGATCVATDPDVVKKLEIDANCPTSNLLGITWNLQTDEITPNDYFSLKGKSMGSTIGKKLRDMKNESLHAIRFPKA